jgi:DNA-binding transcriptional LysR family regulator
MTSKIPSLSTDQVAAFVELARQGSLRRAAGDLHLTEQGIRNRLLALEGRLGAALYYKKRGPRRSSPLTREGRLFLPHALAFLERARSLGELFSGLSAPEEIHVASTQYLILYVLIDAIRRFHRAHPDVRVRLSTHNEQEIEHALLRDPELALGVAAPYEPGHDLVYRDLFALDWGLVTPPGHRLLRKKRIELSDLASEGLIVFEHGSTGRQHVLDAFRECGTSPRVEMEATSTVVVLRMVEAGIGVALVPLMPGNVVTRGHRVGVRLLPGRIRPIHSGILLRKGEPLSPATEAFIRFLQPKSRRSTVA